MKRFLKQRLNRFLPEALRATVKRHLSKKFAESVATTFAVEKTAAALKCTIDNNYSFLAPPNCQVELANLTETAEGRAEFHSLVVAAKSGGTLFDVGAHSGIISAMFCAVNPKNRAYAFEPSPVLAERLVTIRALNKLDDRMYVEQVGIGEETKVVEMMLDPAGGFIQPQHFEHTMWAAPESVQIRMERIQDAATRLNTVPDFIKIDIEGYEFEAIKGATEFLARVRPQILLELHLNYLEQRSLSAKYLVDMLRRCGYVLYTSGGTRLRPGEVYDSPLPIVHVVAR